jgi:hypothetical protein
MSQLNVDTIEPEGASTTLTLGASGDTVALGTGAVQAAGGAGGASDSGTRIGGNGGSGAYAKKLLTGMSDTDTLNITIGAAAAAGASGTTTSVASASGTSFTTITCTGGAGGADSDGTNWGAGGAGGAVPTTGDLNLAGKNGTCIEGYPRLGGVDSQYGRGGANPTDHYAAGGAATGYGAGGQGGAGNTNAGGAVKSTNLDGDLILADSDARVGGTYDGAFHFVEPASPEPTAEELKRAADKQSAHDKLSALGLTDAEITALTGGA